MVDDIGLEAIIHTYTYIHTRTHTYIHTYRGEMIGDIGLEAMTEYDEMWGLA